MHSIALTMVFCCEIMTFILIKLVNYGEAVTKTDIGFSEAFQLVMATRRPVWALGLYMQTYFAAPQLWWWGDDWRTFGSFADGSFQFGELKWRNDDFYYDGNTLFLFYDVWSNHRSNSCARLEAKRM